MSGHVLRVTLDRDCLYLRIECQEPEGAQCRVACASDSCETYTYPDHEHGLCHLNYCNAVEYFDNYDVEECCASAEPSFPLVDGMQVEVLWEGDFYVWWPVQLMR